ncbi:MAG: thymidylate synthase (FAD), partial [Firmicutes bacterium]|nr:thymidylate synthase (FAD) [Bacillota bacterium]
CLKAQWEIRMLAAFMLKEVKKAAPVIFEKAGASCMKGFCPEGDIDCFNKMKRKFRIKAREN